MSLYGASWHYGTEPTFPNSVSISVTYAISRPASEAGGPAFESRPGHHQIPKENNRLRGCRAPGDAGAMHLTAIMTAKAIFASFHLTRFSVCFPKPCRLAGREKPLHLYRIRTGRVFRAWSPVYRHTHLRPCEQRQGAAHATSRPDDKPHDSNRPAQAARLKLVRPRPHDWNRTASLEGYKIPKLKKKA